MELSIPYLELHPLEKKTPRPFPLFILQNYVWGFQFLVA